MHDLTARGLAALDHRCDLPVADVEDVVQQEGGALLGCQPLQEGQEGHGQVVRQLEVAVRRGRADERLGQPRSDVRFPLGLQPPQPVDRQAAGRRDQPRLGVVDPGLVRLMPPDVRLLDDVLGIGT